MTGMSVLELCAGGGGQAIGLERAGFVPSALVEIDPEACATLRWNRPAWPVFHDDITALRPFWADQRPDLVAGGLPCTPHTRGGRQLGEADERHLWDAALGIIAGAEPRAVMLETSNAILSGRFLDERARTMTVLRSLGYAACWEEIDCSRYGVPQRRRRAVLIAFRDWGTRPLPWPQPSRSRPPTVGNTLACLAASYGWPGAEAWAAGAQDLAPTVVGGSRKHGGPDLGGSQGKAAWRKLGIDPMGIASSPPGPDGKYVRGNCRIGDAGETGLMLTTEMAAALQGFPPDWEFCGGKTSRHRQVGNAFPPPAAAAVGTAIARALGGRR